MQRRVVIKSAIGVIFSAALLIFALVSNGWVFGWFSMGHDASGKGMGIITKDADEPEIRAEENGEDISVEVLRSDMQTLSHVDKVTDFMPGACGSFTFYVKDKADEGAFDFIFKVAVDNDQFKNDAEFEEGFYRETGQKDREAALAYLRSHLLFFTAKENDLYSGWIKPDKEVELRAEAQKPHKVTVYWVWVATYDKIFAADSNLIEENTRREIATYYSQEENHTKMFHGDSVSAEAYNMADTLIGVTLKYVYYRVEVLKK